LALPAVHRFDLRRSFSQSDSVISENKKSCADKKEAKAKTCEDGECKIERAQSEPKGQAVPKPK
jgi:hypothetical protein